MINRRNFILGIGGLAVGGLAWRLATAEDGLAKPDSPASTSDIEKVVRSEEEWRAILNNKQFSVLRKEATERPFTSPLNDEKREGSYVCAGCDLPLFKSEWKYDSGTGWPSFYTAIAEHVGKKQDFKLLLPRTEYHCLRCGGHQGHLFSDGPAPTGERWCNNGVALKFIPA